jgi:hypothetical protein
MSCSPSKEKKGGGENKFDEFLKIKKGKFHPKN